MTSRQRQSTKSKRKIAFNLQILLLFACFVLFVVYADVIGDGFIKTLRMCLYSLVPALFPYMMLSSVCVHFLNQGAKSTKAAMAESLLGLPRYALSTLALGALCGFPIGAKTTVDLYNENRISASDAECLFALCNQTGFAFAVLGIGKGMLGNIKDGLFLYFTMLVCALITARIFRREREDAVPSGHRTRPTSRFSLTASIRDASLNTLYIVGFLAFFSIPISLLRHFITKKYLRLLLCVPIELAGGANEVVTLLGTASPLTLPFLAFCISFGGVCVGFQSEMFSSEIGLSMREYYKRKLFQGILAFVITLLFEWIKTKALG